jgi:CheY-like chemotaxis protein
LIPRRVLVVDDNLDQATSIALLLRNAGHEVRIAADGHLAISEAHRFRPDFIFIDLGLPGMDGWQVTKSLRNDPSFSTVRIIAITGQAGEEARRVSLEAGMDFYLVKPVNPKFIESLLGRGKNRR